MRTRRSPASHLGRRMWRQDGERDGRGRWGRGGGGEGREWGPGLGEGLRMNLRTDQRYRMGAPSMCLAGEGTSDAVQQQHGGVHPGTPTAGNAASWQGGGPAEVVAVGSAEGPLLGGRAGGCRRTRGSLGAPVLPREGRAAPGHGHRQAHRSRVRGGRWSDQGRSGKQGRFFRFLFRIRVFLHFG